MPHFYKTVIGLVWITISISTQAAHFMSLNHLPHTMSIEPSTTDQIILFGFNDNENIECQIENKVKILSLRPSLVVTPSLGYQLLDDSTFKLSTPKINGLMHQMCVTVKSESTSQQKIQIICTREGEKRDSYVKEVDSIHESTQVLTVIPTLPSMSEQERQLWQTLKEHQNQFDMLKYFSVNSKEDSALLLKLTGHIKEGVEGLSTQGSGYKEFYEAVWAFREQINSFKAQIYDKVSKQHLCEEPVTPSECLAQVTSVMKQEVMIKAKITNLQTKINHLLGLLEHDLDTKGMRHLPALEWVQKSMIALITLHEEAKYIQEEIDKTCLTALKTQINLMIIILENNIKKYHRLQMEHSDYQAKNATNKHGDPMEVIKLDKSVRAAQSPAKKRLSKLSSPLRVIRGSKDSDHAVK